MASHGRHKHPFPDLLYRVTHRIPEDIVGKTQLWDHAADRFFLSHHQNRQ
jgi:hypothetical protein